MARSYRRATLTILVTTFLIVGCSSTSTPTSAELPEIEGEFGQAPGFSWSGTQPPEDLVVQVLHEGEGPEVTPESMVVVDYEGHVWGSEDAFDSSFSSDHFGHFPLDGVIQGWTEGIPGSTVGSRLLLSIPSDLGYGDQGTPDGSIEGGDTLVFVVDVHGAYTQGETGGDPAAEKVALPDDVGIVVEGDLGQPFSVTIDEDTKEPASLASYPLSQSDNSELDEGDTALISYIATTWDNDVLGATWLDPIGPDSGPQQVTIDEGSLFGELRGYGVGSRVLIVQPATEDDPAVALGVDILAAK